MSYFNTQKSLASGALCALLASTSALADHNDDFANSERFRDNHPLNVFVDIDTKAKGRRDDRLEDITLRAVRSSLPGNIRIVSNRRDADMVIRAEERDFDVDFRIVDRDRKEKRYDKVNPRTGNQQCGPFYKVSYTEVKERAEGHAVYDIRVSMPGVGRDRERIKAEASAYNVYGENLLAHNRCGSEPTARFPGYSVVDLFGKNNPKERQRMAIEVRRETAEDLGRKLAHEIRENADDYYASLSVRFAYESNYRDGRDGRHEGRHDHHDGDRGWHDGE